MAHGCQTKTRGNFWMLDWTVLVEANVSNVIIIYKSVIENIIHTVDCWRRWKNHQPVSTQVKLLMKHPLTLQTIHSHQMFILASKVQEKYICYNLFIWIVTSIKAAFNEAFQEKVCITEWDTPAKLFLAE